MNWCHETTKMGVPARHASKARRARATGQPQGAGPEAYLNGTSQGPVPEDARKDNLDCRLRIADLRLHKTE